MNTFDFTVILANKNNLTEQDAERLFEAGCDDATPGVTNQVAMIHFSRDAVSFQDAIISAKSDVEKAGFTVDRVEIGAREIAELAATP